MAQRGINMLAKSRESFCSHIFSCTHDFGVSSVCVCERDEPWKIAKVVLEGAMRMS